MGKIVALNCHILLEAISRGPVTEGDGNGASLVE